MLHIDQDSFDRLIEQNPSIARGIYRVLNQHLRNMLAQGQRGRRRKWRWRSDRLLDLPDNPAEHESGESLQDRNHADSYSAQRSRVSPVPMALL